MASFHNGTESSKIIVAATLIVVFDLYCCATANNEAQWILHLLNNTARTHGAIS